MEASGKSPVADLFDRVAPTYDCTGPRFFSHFGTMLADAAEIPARGSVLDLACGKGASLLPAARRVGPEGRAIGIDLSVNMVREARADARRSGLSNVEVRKADAESTGLPDRLFDVVLCGFSASLFPRPATVFKEAYRVLKPGGRIAVTTWAEDCEYLNWVMERVGSQLPGATGSWGSLSAPAGLWEALRRAGFQGTDPAVIEADFFYASEAEWWASLWSCCFRGALDRMHPQARERLRADCRETIESMRVDRGIRVALRALLTSGVKPFA